MNATAPFHTRSIAGRTRCIISGVNCERWQAMAFNAASSVGRRETNVDREILRFGNEQGRRAALRVGRSKRLERQIHIEQVFWHPGRAGAL